jgi:hypothetical protein
VDYIAWEPSFGVVNDLRYEVGLTDAMVTDQPYSLLYKGVFDQAPLFLADMRTTFGGDTANLRWDNRTEVGLEVWVSEEQSRDSETGHIPEAVGYLVVDVEGDTGKLAMEVGEVSVDHEWQRVDFTNPFLEPPVVVAKPISNNGGQPATVRISGVDTTGFWVRVQEWEYLDGWHAVEQVSFIAMESGYHQLPGGALVEAGRIQSSGSSAYVTAGFTAPFGEAPVVFATITSTNEADAAVTRSRNISTAGFELRLQEQELNAQQHLPESVDYIAWEPSFGVVNGLSYEVGLTDAMVTDQPYSLLYKGAFDQAPLFLADIQTTFGGDTANLRWDSRTEVGLEVWVSEEQSRDSETAHIAEAVGYLVVDHKE